MKTINDYTTKEWYALPIEERSKLWETPENLNIVLAEELQFLSSHKCRGHKAELRGWCNSCGPTIKAIQVLREMGAKLPTEIMEAA